MLEIPEEYRELLSKAGTSVLSFLCKDGSVQSTLAWSDFEHGLISICVPKTSIKYRRLVENGKATVLKYDPRDERKYISIRCSLVRVESEGAIDFLNKLTQRHYGKEKWYGEVEPDSQEKKLNEVIVYLKPEKVYFT